MIYFNHKARKISALSFYFILMVYGLLTSCNKNKREEQVEQPLFTELNSTETGIDFMNPMRETPHFNILNYEYLYNGGGVAVGDINNDGLPDLFFTSTMKNNGLFLNNGNLKFTNISQSAGIARHNGLCTGVEMIDINNDGWLDIFICQTGLVPVSDRAKLLYINNHNNTFTESAAQYGLNDNSFTNQATFFDFDHDGDLDVFLANHPIDFGYANKVILQPDTSTQYVSYRFYRNDNNHFTDITKQAGLAFKGYALSANVCDINQDGYPDLYVCNDYLSRDYLFINNKNGTFSDQLEKYVKHISNFCMGSDIADFNNDGLPDIVTLDMTPEDNYRKKMLLGGMSYDGYQLAVKNGFYHQYMRNMLQVNNGNNTFSEIAQLSGIYNTDWSWAPLLEDFDNDGWKDLFVTNGYRHDVTNMDYSKYTLDSMNKAGGIKADSIYKLINIMPTQAMLNYVFKNNGDLTFTKKTSEWGITTPTFSNGAAYADLDNDGDMDMIVNNIDMEAIVYKNNSRENHPDQHYLQIKFNGQPANLNGIGATVKIETDIGLQVETNMPFKGYLSSVENKLHFGLGKNKTVKKLEITWPDGKMQHLQNVEGDKVLTVNYSDAKEQLQPANSANANAVFKNITQSSGISFQHTENDYIDFKREPLLPQKFSMSGPCLTVGDINGDGTDDFFAGGATGYAGVLFIQQKDGTFKKTNSIVFEKDKLFEDVNAEFFDADGDGDLDLYVVSGGNEFDENSANYQDRLYMNDGKGNFTRNVNALPQMNTSGSCVRVSDFDGDGDLDLFIGGKIVPGKYPVSPRSYVLQNDKGIFKDATENVCKELMYAGMINDAQWTDIDGDKQPDLVVAGMWMPLTVFKNEHGKLKNITKGSGLDSSNGWWNCITACDFDNDGDMDFVTGNLGLNSRMKAKPDEPCCVYAKDFDRNGSIDAIMCYYVQGISYPMEGRDLMLDQIRELRKKYLRYEQYANATIYDFYPKETVDSALILRANTFATSWIENIGQGKFKIHELPLRAQFAPAQNFLCEDFDGDGNKDILMADNMYSTEIEIGRYDAGTGLLLKGNGKGNFVPVKISEGGFFNNKDARFIRKLKHASDNKTWIIIANNNDSIQVFEKK
ncbi:MAG: VCBS repeat-containing protein [Bacteroidia bacterium]